MAHDSETRLRARALYIEEGLTFAKIKDVIGVNEATLWRWAQAEGWRQKREDLRATLDDIRTNTIRLRKRLIEKVLTGLDDGDVNPMNIFAVSSLESAAAKLIATDQAGEIETTEPEREITKAGEAVEALQEAISRKLNRMLAKPDEKKLLDGIKDVKAAQEMVDGLRKQWAVEQEAGKVSVKKGLSEEKASEIRRRILGLKS